MIIRLFQTMPKSEEEKKNKNLKRANSYMRYTGMGFQMGIIILIGAIVGKKLDENFQTDRPYFTILLAVAATFAAMYLALKDFIFPKK